MNKDSRIYIAGHRGLVGSAIWRLLEFHGFTNLIGKTRRELDLTDPNAVYDFYRHNSPEYVVVAAAKVGGIMANNTEPASFLYENLQIQNNLIHNAYAFGVKKLLFLGSSCIYPKLADQPIKEETLLTGPLEPTNEWYAIAKIAGIKMCQAYRKQYGCDFICAMPTNLYGPNDNYDPQSSHVIPAMLRRFHEAKCAEAEAVVCWGTGRPMREFLYSDDLASACFCLMEKYSEEQVINVGYGEDIKLMDLAPKIAATVGFKGAIRWDYSKPDGTPRKIVDSSRMRDLGWKPSINLEDGLSSAYLDMLSLTLQNC